MRVCCFLIWRILRILKLTIFDYSIILVFSFFLHRVRYLYLTFLLSWFFWSSWDSSNASFFISLFQPWVPLAQVLRSLDEIDCFQWRGALPLGTLVHCRWSVHQSLGFVFVGTNLSLLLHRLRLYRRDGSFRSLELVWFSHFMMFWIINRKWILF